MDSGNVRPQSNFEVPKQPGRVENVPNKVAEQLPSSESPNPSAPPPTPVIITDPSAYAQPSSSINPSLGDDDLVKHPISTNLQAEDADLIEKEWVTKAKHIVEQTKNDPFVQNQEISKVKAEYISKRFDKQVKLPKENP